MSVCARMFGGLGVGGLEESGSKASAESLMIACVVDRLEAFEPDPFLFSDCFCLPHHALPTVFTHCAK